MKQNTRLSGGIPEIADTLTAPPRMAGKYPWQNPHRQDVQRQLNMKQPERFLLMLAWLSAQNGRTKREMVEDALHEWLSKEMHRRGIPFSP